MLLLFFFLFFLGSGLGGSSLGRHSPGRNGVSGTMAPQVDGGLGRLRRRIGIAIVRLAGDVAIGPRDAGRGGSLGRLTIDLHSAGWPPRLISCLEHSIAAGLSGTIRVADVESDAPLRQDLNLLAESGTPARCRHCRASLPS